MPETISEERLRELEGQCGDGSFDDGYGFHGGDGEGLSLSELRALIAEYREGKKTVKERDVALAELSKWARMCGVAEGRLFMLKSRIDAVFQSLGDTDANE